MTVSPDGSVVYVTKNTGKIEVLAARSGKLRWSYQPSPFLPGWSITCKSGVTFSSVEGVKYAIYAVIDVPPAAIPMEEDAQS